MPAHLLGMMRPVHGVPYVSVRADCSPTAPLFDGTWTLPDVEPILTLTGERWRGLARGVVGVVPRGEVVVTMRPDPKARPRLPRCRAFTQATASQFAALSALPDPVEPVTPHLVCELADGHDDDHAALAVASHGGDQWWWLRWDRRRHEVVQIDPCEVTEREASDPEFCLFPAGHPGSHSFDLQPWPGRNVVDEYPFYAAQFGGVIPR